MLILNATRFASPASPAAGSSLLFDETWAGYISGTLAAGAKSVWTDTVATAPDLTILPGSGLVQGQNAGGGTTPAGSATVAAALNLSDSYTKRIVAAACQLTSHSTGNSFIQLLLTVGGTQYNAKVVRSGANAFNCFANGGASSDLTGTVFDATNFSFEYQITPDGIGHIYINGALVRSDALANGSASSAQPGFGWQWGQSGQTIASVGVQFGEIKVYGHT